MTAEGPWKRGPFVSVLCGRCPTYSLADLIDDSIGETVESPHYGPFALSVDPRWYLHLDRRWLTTCSYTFALVFSLFRGESLSRNLDLVAMCP